MLHEGFGGTHKCEPMVKNTCGWCGCPKSESCTAADQLSSQIGTMAGVNHASLRLAQVDQSPWGAPEQYLPPDTHATVILLVINVCHPGLGRDPVNTDL